MFFFLASHKMDEKQNKTILVSFYLIRHYACHRHHTGEGSRANNDNIPKNKNLRMLKSPTCQKVQLMRIVKSKDIYIYRYFTSLSSNSIISNYFNQATRLNMQELRRLTYGVYIYIHTVSLCVQAIIIIIAYFSSK